MREVHVLRADTAETCSERGKRCSEIYLLLGPLLSDQNDGSVAGDKIVYGVPLRDLGGKLTGPARVPLIFRPAVTPTVWAACLGLEDIMEASVPGPSRT